MAATPDSNEWIPLLRTWPTDTTHKATHTTHTPVAHWTRRQADRKGNEETERERGRGVKTHRGLGFHKIAP